MAGIAADLFAALDGVADPGVGNWHFPYFNEEMAEAITAMTNDSDVLLLGRVTYDILTSGAWPTPSTRPEQDATFTYRLGDMPRVLASPTPLQFRWHDSEQLQCELVKTAAALKLDPAIRSVGVSGSVSVLRQLLDSGFVDELHLFVHPATAGSGRLRLEDRDPAPCFSLVSSQPFNTGLIHPGHS